MLRFFRLIDKSRFYDHLAISPKNQVSHIFILFACNLQNILMHQHSHLIHATSYNSVQQIWIRNTLLTKSDFVCSVALYRYIIYFTQYVACYKFQLILFFIPRDVIICIF